MPKMHIKKSIKIDAPVEKVFNTISDFHHWQPWSPWLIMEPEAKVTVDDDGKAYSWEGKKVGSGEMKITREEANQRLDVDLTFLKPWKSHAKVWFEINSSEDVNHTKLSWYMESSLPFFMFWMTKTMTALIGMDYDRGLSMLKDYIEMGSVPSKMEIAGESTFEGGKYIGIHRVCGIEALGPTMSEDFKKITKWSNENKDRIAGIPFSIYHKWDFSKGIAEYTSGTPVKEFPENPGAEFITGEISATKVYTIKHIGPYRHLGNAWSAGQNLMRNKVFKASKRIPPFEVYESNPMTTDENELVTEINFPVK